MDLLLRKRKLDENGVILHQTGSMDTITKLTLDDSQKLVSNLTQEQLADILKHALLRHPDILDAVRTFSDRDVSLRKLFVRALGWDTTSDSLGILFAGYGEIEEAVVIMDKATGKSKGFGFVTFKHVDGALLALKEPSKQIDGRMTVTQLASAGGAGGTGVLGPGHVPQSSVGNGTVGDVAARKIYVATVPFDFAPDKLLAHFASYGEIEEGPLGFDKTTGKSKGFALFVYKTAEGAQKALLDPMKNINGIQMNCKLANEGKKHKHVTTSMQAPAPVVNQAPVGSHGVGAPAGNPNAQSSFVPGSMPMQYGAGFSGGPQVHPALGHHHHFNNFPSAIGSGPPLSTIGGQSAWVGNGGFGAGLGGPYAASLHYSGPGSTGFGGFPGANSGLSGSLSGSLYGRIPPNSIGMPTSAYAESAHYTLSSNSAFPGQQHQPERSSPGPRAPPGGMYSGVPHYY